MRKHIVEMLVDVEADAQVLNSSEADFDNHTWEFHAPTSFRCWAGEFVVIPRADWEKFKAGLLDRGQDSAPGSET